MYFINLHGGILPQRAGVNIACHAIIEGDEYSGGTLHLINEKIDSGDILAIKKFRINSYDTSLSVYHKTNIALLDLVKENLESIISGNLKPIPQSHLIINGNRKYFRKVDISKIKELSLNMEIDYIDRVVRGCDFPGHEPAYIIYNGRKIYLTTQRFFTKNNDSKLTNIQSE